VTAEPCHDGGEESQVWQWKDGLLTHRATGLCAQVYYSTIVDNAEFSKQGYSVVIGPCGEQAHHVSDLSYAVFID